MHDRSCRGQEDIAYGERVSQYVLEAFVDGAWLELTRGSAIGHKKIDAFAPVSADKVRLRVLKSAASPRIKTWRFIAAGNNSWIFT